MYIIFYHECFSVKKSRHGKKETRGVLDCQKANFSAVRGNVQPYAFKRMDVVRGPVHKVISDVLESCCGSDIDMVIHKEVLRERTAEKQIGNADLAYPVAKMPGVISAMKQISGYLYLPVMETTGE